MTLKGRIRVLISKVFGKDSFFLTPAGFPSSMVDVIYLQMTVSCVILFLFDNDKRQ